jgi:thiol-disulfide isomerase/thioredoxin
VTTGLAVALGALAAATAVGLWWRSRNGRVRATAGLAIGSMAGADSPASSELAVTPAELSAADLGATLGLRATLVQFSSAFCAPCRATRQVLADVARMVDGVNHIEIDAESRLDLVRKLDVWRTPTTFVLGPDGHVTHRASGQPRKADVIAALGVLAGGS